MLSLTCSDTAHLSAAWAADFLNPLRSQGLLDTPSRFHALVLSPTRELALQIKEQIEALGAGIAVKCAALVGGIDMVSQVWRPLYRLTYMPVGWHLRDLRRRKRFMALCSDFGAV